MSTKKKQSLAIVAGEDLHPAHLAKVIRASEEYTKKVNARRIEFPDPDTINWDSEEAEFQLDSSGFLSNALGIKSRKQKSKGGGGGNQPKLPNPQTVLTEVLKYYQGLQPVGMKGNLVLGEFNAEFGDSSKAKYFKGAYTEIFSRLHLVAVIEVADGWVNDVAGFLGYKGFTSKANTRNQAVGFLVHPRLEVIGAPVEYDAVASVQGVPDLRPAFRINLRDTVTGEEFSVTNLHLKSMRGGAAATSVIRRKQMDILAKALGPNYKGFVTGDMNFILDDPKVTDGEPLKNAGFQLFMPSDHTPTQSMGSRIDGWFFKNLKRQFRFYQVRRFYANPQITRAFGDHAETQGQLVFCESQFQDGKQPNAGCQGGADDSDFPIDVQPQNNVHFPQILPTFGKPKK